MWVLVTVRGNERSSKALSACGKNVFLLGFSLLEMHVVYLGSGDAKPEEGRRRKGKVRPELGKSKR